MWSTLSALWRHLVDKFSRGWQRDEEDEVAELVIGQPFDFQKKVVVVEDGVLKVTPGPV